MGLHGLPLITRGQFAWLGEKYNIMFDCPDGTPPLTGDESVFSCFDWNRIAEILNEKPGETFISAAADHAMAAISNLAVWATEELITVDLICSSVENAIDVVKSKKPWTMSWSNVLDYLDPKSFHRLARDCSIHGETIHFGYSMNWVTNVYGTNIIDFQGKGHVGFRAKVIDSANQAVKAAYEDLGYDSFLRLPPPTNPINTTAHFGFEVLHYKKWAEHFFDFAREYGPCHVAKVEHVVGSPLSCTGASTVAFTWTYDPDITFVSSLEGS